MHEEEDALAMMGPDDHSLSPWNALGQVSVHFLMNADEGVFMAYY